MSVRSLLPVALLALAVLGGCDRGEPPAPPSSKPRPAKTALPASPKPAKVASCPYLDNQYVADTNGQLVRAVQISNDKPIPACFFYAYEGDQGVQLAVRVYQGNEAIAHKLVDQAAPQSTSSLADQPQGWSGGSQPTKDGAVYAVAKGGKAVIVKTNQKQTVKAREITETTIRALKL